MDTPAKASSVYGEAVVVVVMTVEDAARVYRYAVDHIKYSEGVWRELRRLLAALDEAAEDEPTSTELSVHLAPDVWRVLKKVCHHALIYGSSDIKLADHEAFVLLDQRLKTMDFSVLIAEAVNAED